MNVVAMLLDQSIDLESLCSITEEQLNPSVAVHHLVGKLPAPETLFLTEEKCKASTCQGKCLLKFVS